MFSKKLDIKIKTRLFPYIENVNKMKDLKIDHESICYISLREDADMITKIIKESITLKENEKFSDLYITDATAGVGGNTISFGKTFKYVNAIEIDKIRFKYLQNNIEVYNLNNVNVYNNDCLDILHRLYHDIIFFDPPWGGKNYKFQDNLKLKLSDNHIEDICIDIKNKSWTRCIVLKLPLNYDIDFLKVKLNNYDMSIHTLNKMLIVVL